MFVHDRRPNTPRPAVPGPRLPSRGGILANALTLLAIAATLLLMSFVGNASAVAPTDGTGAPPPIVAVAAGDQYICILLSTGNADCHGRNEYGEANDYTGGDAVAIDVGQDHTCVLLTSGNVHCYGRNDFGQSEDYAGGDAVAVRVGQWHTCVVLSSGNVECYGENRNGEANDYHGGDAVDVDGWQRHTCILLASGNTTCNGTNHWGKAEAYLGGDAIGIGTGVFTTCMLVSGGNVTCVGAEDWGFSDDYTAGDAVGMSIAQQRTCVLRTDGNVRCNGIYSGQWRFVTHYWGGDAVSVSAGAYQTCVLRTNNAVRCFGPTNAYDYNYTIDTTNDTTPPVMTLPPDLRREATGPAGVVVNWTANATDDSGWPSAPACIPASGSIFPLGTTTVTCTSRDLSGNTASGQFNVTVEDTTPPVISARADKTAIASTQYGAAVRFEPPTWTDAVDGTGAATCTPASGSQFPHGETAVTCMRTDAAGNAAEPTVFVVRVIDHPLTVAVSAGYNHTCVQLHTGNVDCFGDNDYAHMYDHVSGDARAVSASYEYGCILLTNGNVECDRDGQLGQSRDYAGGDAIAISSGYYHSCIILASRNVDCYGFDVYGESADDASGNAVAVAAGGYHTCILRPSGSVSCHGRNAGDLDYGGTDAVAVSAGEFHSCVLLRSGNVECRGANDRGQAGDYEGGLAVAVSAGNYHTCILLDTGNVDCWGWNDYGQAIDYNGGDAVAVSAGWFHTCILLMSGNVTCHSTASGQLDTGYVVDTQPPVLALPARLTKEADGPQGAVVAWAAKATDDRGWTSTVECAPASEFMFPIGSTNVSCSSTDMSGNVATGSFVVEVLPVVPREPENLKATTGPGVGEVSLAWEAPLWDGGAAVTHYSILRLTSEGEVLVANTTSTDFVVEGDAAGGRHHFVVRAVNGVGVGAASEEAAATATGPPDTGARPATEPNEDGSIDVYVDADGDGRRDPGEDTLTVPPVLP